MKTDNYIKALKASIEIQQKRKEIKKLMREISDLLTLDEVVNRTFCHESAKNAWAVFDKGVIIENSSSGESKKIMCGDVYILVCCDPEKQPATAMRYVLEPIDTNDLVKAIK